MVQRLPFQCSMSASSVVPDLLEVCAKPTAQQFVVQVQTSPPINAASLRPPPGFGLGTVAHDEPFHRSTRVLVPVRPTATQNCRLRQEIPFMVGWLLALIGAAA